jgi:hypothetical protein
MFLLKHKLWHIQEMVYFEILYNILIWGWACSLVIEYMLSMCEALGLISKNFF